MQKLDKIWTLFILWRWQTGQKGWREGGRALEVELYNHKRMMSRGISIWATGKGLNSGNNWDKTFLGQTFPQWSDAFKGQLAKQLEWEQDYVSEAQRAWRVSQRTTVVWLRFPTGCTDVTFCLSDIADTTTRFVSSAIKWFPYFFPASLLFSRQLQSPQEVAENVWDSRSCKPFTLGEKIVSSLRQFLSDCYLSSLQIFDSNTLTFDQVNVRVKVCEITSLRSSPTTDLCWEITR